MNAAVCIDNLNVDVFNRKELSIISSTSPLRLFDLHAEIYGVNTLGMITSVLWNHETACSKCEGEGEIECDHCGHSAECEECDGSGFVLLTNVLVTRCDGCTIIKIMDRDFCRHILECGSEESDDLTVHPDAWEVV